MQRAIIIPLQPQLPQVLPTIEGNVDYRDLRDQLLLMDRLLVTSGLEEQLIQSDLERWAAGTKQLTARSQHTRQSHARRALRCNIARRLLKHDYRELAVRLADSPLLQCFCGISQVDCIQVPSKSTLERYDKWWPPCEIRGIIRHLLKLGATKPEKIHLPEPVDLENAFLDTTCLAANIHYPVDWVLLRDATRTLMKALQLIRGQGLKHRMEAPESFITRINTLCIGMTHSGRKTQLRRHRKKILRQMDRVVGSVRNHARRYRDLLDKRWQETSWTRPQAQQVLRRMDRVLEQLPQARKQARQRILEEEPVDNAQKILSLYEPDVHVIVRRKAGAQVEFGNTLLLAENSQGLILDWELFRQSAPADSALLARFVGSMEEAYGRTIKAVGADRGFDSQTNQRGLADEGIYNGICPRDPKILRRRKDSWKFKKMQRRRSQTEGRIGIFKNAFGAGQMRCKGFEHRELTVTWTVLVHNLWVLARLQRKAIEESERRKAA
jgi:hypothetical protein